LKVEGKKNDGNSVGNKNIISEARKREWPFVLNVERKLRFIFQIS